MARFDRTNNSDLQITIPSTSRNPHNDPITNNNASVIGQIEPDEEQDNNTVHTSIGNPILTIKITEKPLNYYLYKIIVTEANDNPRIEIREIFERRVACTCWYIYVTKD